MFRKHSRKLLLASAALSLTLLMACFSHSGPAYQEFTYKNSRGETLPYRFLKPKEPKKGERYPLVLAFHGAGERGTDNRQQVGNGLMLFTQGDNPDKYPCYVLVPQCPEGKRWVEVDWGLDAHRMPDTPSTPMRLTLELLDKTLKELPIDTNRIYVTGLSMGGFATWDLIERFPGRFAAAAPVCGGGDETKAALLINTPIWAFHGDKDRVVKPSRSRNMIHAITQAGGHPRYTEYKNMGHNAWDSAYRHNPELLPWMFSHSKNKK